MVEWFESSQAQGQRRFRELGLPRNENWKYTSLKALEQAEFVKAPAGDAAAFAQDPEFLAYREARGLEMVFVNGRFEPALSDLSLLPSGVRMRSLAASVSGADSEFVRHLLEFYPSHTESSFQALNRSFLTDGCVMVVKRDIICEEPLHLVFISEGGPSLATDAARTLIFLEEGAHLDVVESYIGSPGSLTTAVTDVHLAEGAQMRLLKAQKNSQYHVGSHRVRQARKSRFAALNLSVGGQLTRHELNVQVLGPNCETELDGLYLVSDREHVDHTTQLDHLEPNCFSRQHYKGILADRARGVFRGLIRIDPKAQQTQSSQLNNNLLLSSQAEIDTLPQLEIYADDVKATHGATVGQLGEEELFYIRSRAISSEVARQMMLTAFAGEVLERWSSPYFAGIVQQIAGGPLAQMAMRLS